jgi:hypothetical protein
MSPGGTSNFVGQIHRIYYHADIILYDTEFYCIR